MARCDVKEEWNGCNPIQVTFLGLANGLRKRLLHQFLSELFFSNALKRCFVSLAGHFSGSFRWWPLSLKEFFACFAVRGGRPKRGKTSPIQKPRAASFQRKSPPCRRNTGFLTGSRPVVPNPAQVPFLEDYPLYVFAESKRKPLDAQAQTSQGATIILGFLF